MTLLGFQMIFVVRGLMVSNGDVQPCPCHTRLYVKSNVRGRSAPRAAPGPTARSPLLALGLFVALALQFDVFRGEESQYFKSAFLGYTVGLVLIIIDMNWFQAAQLALLYIVPAVIGFLAAHVICSGDIMVSS